MATTDIYHISGPLLPARKAFKNIGGNTDDYLQVNAAAVALVAADNAQGTWSAWINMANITGTFCIACAGDDNVVEFLELNVEAGLLTARCTDATTAQFVTQADAVHFRPHRWYHVAMVQAADGLGTKLYVNGAKIASTNDTATDVNEWFVNLDGIDTMRIGAANKAGDASVTNEFSGAISDVKIWSTALTDAQVLADYEGNGPASATLENHWPMDDDYVDLGLGADNGTAVGDILLVNNYSEFSSRLAFMPAARAVVADTFVLSCNNNVGHAVIIKAA